MSLQGFLLEQKPENAAAIIQDLNQVVFIFAHGLNYKSR